jgi:hypothetical protein
MPPQVPSSNGAAATGQKHPSIMEMLQRSAAAAMPNATTHALGGPPQANTGSKLVGSGELMSAPTPNSAGTNGHALESGPAASCSDAADRLQRTDSACCAGNSFNHEREREHTPYDASASRLPAPGGRVAVLQQGPSPAATHAPAPAGDPSSVATPQTAHDRSGHMVSAIDKAAPSDSCHDQARAPGAAFGDNEKQRNLTVRPVPAGSSVTAHSLRLQQATSRPGTLPPRGVAPVQTTIWLDDDDDDDDFMMLPPRMPSQAAGIASATPAYQPASAYQPATAAAPPSRIANSASQSVAPSARPCTVEKLRVELCSSCFSWVDHDYTKLTAQLHQNTALASVPEQEHCREVRATILDLVCDGCQAHKAGGLPGLANWIGSFQAAPQGVHWLVHTLASSPPWLAQDADNLTSLLVESYRHHLGL